MAVGTDQHAHQAGIGDGEAERRLRAYQDGIPHLSWTARADGTIDFCNRRWVEYAGRPLCGLLENELISALHPEDATKVMERWTHAIASGEHFEEDVRIRRHDGVYRWHAMRDWPSRDQHGVITGWYGTATDVEDQRRTADNLRAANEDLDQFASIAAHDLQEPLRLVVTYLERVGCQAGATLSDQEREYIDLAGQGTARMQRLIRHLLDFAQVDRAELHLASVNLAVPLTEALKTLDLRLSETAGTVTHGTLPEVFADSDLLARLFQNLIGNAIKYQRPGVPPRICIEARIVDGSCEVCVRDNGLGMPQEDCQRIFGDFTRLPTKYRIPGHGLGLAICKKIAERHGGRIWATSDPGVGSAFRFTLGGPTLA